jgi:hypothetical protein
MLSRLKRSLLTVCLLVLGIAGNCLAEKQTPQSLASLAKPADAGTYSSRLFGDSRKMAFSLVTSWIPGEGHKGMLRYRMAVAPDNTAPQGGQPVPPLTPEETSELVQRVYGCVIELNLFDSDDFLLRKIVVPLSLGVDDKDRVIALHANASVQMDADEYRKFLAGQWNISWSCKTP